MNPTAEQAPVITLLDHSDLHPNSWNRKHHDPVALQELADSIEEQGIVQPLIVRPYPPHQTPELKMKFPTHEIIAGERRWRAADLAKVKKLPCIVRDIDERKAREICAIENLQRENLTALEEAVSYRELLEECQCKVEDLEERLGKKRSHIYARMRLANLPEAIRKALGSGAIEASVADIIATIPDAKQQEAALAKILKHKEWDSATSREVATPMSVRAVKALVEEEYRKNLKGCLFDQKQKFGELPTCAECPKRTGNIPGLAHGTNPNICTDTVCFGRKDTLHRTALLQKHKDAGDTVLEAKEAKTLWRYGSLAYRAPYIAADATFYDHKRKKNIPLAKALGKKMPAPVYAVDPEGAVTKLYPKAETYAAAEAAKLIKPQHHDKPLSPEEKAKQKAKEEKLKAEEKIQAQVMSRAVSEVLTPMEQGKNFGTWLAPLCRDILDALDSCDGVNHELFAQRRGLDLSGAHIIDELKKGSGWEMLAAVAECFLAVDAYSHGYERDHIEALAKNVGVKLDWKAIEKEVRAELKEETPAPAKGATLMAGTEQFDSPGTGPAKAAAPSTKAKGKKKAAGATGKVKSLAKK